MSSDAATVPQREQVRCKRFESQKWGITSVWRDRRMIEDAQRKALEWINANPDARIISVDTTCGRLLTVATVWYKQ